MLNSHRAKGRWFVRICALVAMSVLLIVSVWKYQEHRGRDANAAKSLMMIGMALRLYHNDYGSFPPAYIADERGTPKHSWRVLLLPYLGYDQLYEKYRFDQAWDSPDNTAVAAEGCDIYRSPRGLFGRNTTTPYLVVVGKHTAWPGGYAIQEQDITDRLSETILVLDCVVSDVKWTEPRDLTFADALSLRGTATCLAAARNRSRGVLYLDALGGIGRLPGGFSLSLLKSLLTINAGERITDEEWVPKDN